MNGPGNGYYVTPAMVEKQAAAMRAKSKEARMKPLREWIEDELESLAHDASVRIRASTDRDRNVSVTDCRLIRCEGQIDSLNKVLKELKVRDDAEREDKAIEGARICEVPLLYEDARPITAIYWESEAGAEHAVGRSGVTKILLYLDHTTLWFAVYQGDFLSRRVPAYEVCVLYANTGEKI